MMKLMNQEEKWEQIQRGKMKRTIEDIDKCEENKIFKLFPGIERSFLLFWFISYGFISYKTSYLR